MTDAGEFAGDERLDAYLDGTLDAAARTAFEASLRDDPSQQRAIELQRRIEARIAHLFDAEAPSQDAIAAMLAGRAAIGAPPAPRAGRPWWAIAGVAAAALLGGVLITTRLAPSARIEPVFSARPLVQLYHDAVAGGFEATYECSDPARFADTFSRRQGLPLRLLALPAGAQMLGLSYPGGLSRDTTAMLCRVDGQPVMVFVDRLTADRATTALSSDAGAHVFRQERDGLVFYEVTPFDAARITEYLAPLAPANAGRPAI